MFGGLSLAVVVYLGGGLGAFSSHSTTLLTAEDTHVIGVFDWEDSIRVVESPPVRQFVLDLNDRSEWKEASDAWAELRAAPQRMITVQTWSTGSRTYADNPLTDVDQGRYDDLFRRFLTALPDRGADTYLRFDPDMEVPAEALPWQQYPSVYISAYRRFAGLCRELAPEARLVWAPAGYPGALEYYPGDDVVDAASVTFRYPGESTLSAYPSDYPPDYELFRRLHRLRFLRVPVFALAGEGAGDAVVLARVAELLRAGGPGLYGTMPSLTEVTRDLPQSRDRPLAFGLYDPNHLLLDDPNVGVEHVFLDLENLANGSFDTLFRGVMDRGHAAIVTLEPFFPPIDSLDYGMLEAVAAGTYDSLLLRLFRILGTAEREVYLRYAHEMEIPIHRYPWQSLDPLTYIRGYRYVMLHDSLPAAVHKVWGPAGDRGSLEWYPGDDAVDVVSIAIYGLPDKNITDPKQQEQFPTIFNRKMWRMRFVNKPVFITEFGVKGPEEYQTDWMLRAAQTLRSDPRIVGVNYFNMSDTPAAWGEIKPPDWSISRATLDRFTAALQEVE